MNLLPVLVFILASNANAQPGIVAIGDLPGGVPVSALQVERLARQIWS